MYTNKNAIVFSSYLLLQACAAWHEQALAVPYKIIYSGNYCDINTNETAVILRASDKQLSDEVAANRHIIHDSSRSIPVISNYNNELLLKLSMGKFSTAGYAIKVLRAEQIEQTLILHIDWIEPVPGNFTAQVVTQPCVYISVPVTGMSRVKAIDSRGIVRIDNNIQAVMQPDNISE